MLESPVISIIVPVYNVEQYVERCIESILVQTFQNFELILIDDGSTDGSGEICDAYSLKDTRIIVIHKINGGQSSARNEGLEIARGGYVGFVDADDYLAPGMFKTLYDLVVKYNADISECGFISVFQDREIVCDYGSGIEFGEGDYLLGKFLGSDIFYGVWTKLYKKELFSEIRFPEGRIYEDTWMTLYFCLQPLKYVRTQKPLYFYDQRSMSTLRSEVTPRKAREYIHILESQIHLINCMVNDTFVKRMLYKRILEKSILWYLDLALSDKKKIRRLYSKLYLARINLIKRESILSLNLPLKNKISFLLCRMGMSSFVRLVKNL
jgi:glycosyltransferase involved in cell wall biosynthesis